jgi:hypothetical protein
MQSSGARALNVPPAMVRAASPATTTTATTNILPFRTHGGETQTGDGDTEIATSTQLKEGRFTTRVVWPNSTLLLIPIIITIIISITAASAPLLAAHSIDIIGDQSFINGDAAIAASSLSLSTAVVAGPPITARRSRATATTTLLQTKTQSLTATMTTRPTTLATTNSMVMPMHRLTQKSMATATTSQVFASSLLDRLVTDLHLDCSSGRPCADRLNPFGDKRID